MFYIKQLFTGFNIVRIELIAIANKNGFILMNNHIGNALVETLGAPYGLPGFIIQRQDAILLINIIRINFIFGFCAA
ncbi:hypothetical protein D9M68_914570 [compost metagenome]